MAERFLHRHIGSNMEALFKVVYHSLCVVSFLLFTKTKSLGFICDVYVSGVKDPQLGLSFCIKFHFVMMSFFLFPVFFPFISHI